MQALSFVYPVWYLLLCGLAGLTVAGLLYFRSPIEASTPLKAGMAVLRFVGYTLLATLLLAPLLRFVDTDRQEPIIVLAQDGSESIGLETDTLDYSARWAALRAELSERYRVVQYVFGSSPRRAEDLSFTDKQTNLEAVLAEIGDVYGTQNLGGVVLATDGIYNEGANPVYRDFPLPAPVYTVGLGDTTRRRDLVVSRVLHNRIAYLDDQFSIQIDVSARNAPGESTVLTVSRVDANGVVPLHTERINLDDQDYFTTRAVILDADRPGVQRYRIAVSTIGREVSTQNNQRDIFVDVLDARQRILVLAAAPHPDLGALRQALIGGKNNEVEVAYGNEFTGSPRDFDLVILHELPTVNQRLTGLLEALGREEIPTLFITGPGLPGPLLNAAQDLVQVSGSRSLSGQVQANEVTAVPVSGFSAFTLSDDLRRTLPAFPPVQAPFGNFVTGPGAQVLLRQRIGRVDTDFPLLAVGESRNRRVGILTAAGLWQWRLYDYLENEDHARFDELISQLTQYLTVQEDKRRFRVATDESIFDENEPVRFDAELYNSSYELVNDPEATLVVTGAEGREFNFTFSRTESAYALNAGTLPPGNYRYRGRVTDGGEELISEGQFSVQTVEAERYALEADHNLLRQLSARYGGELVYPDALEGLAGRIDAGGTAVPILFETVNTRSVLNLKLLFFLLFTLFATEWGLRRWSGNY